MSLVKIGGDRVGFGLNDLVVGKIDDEAVKTSAFEKAKCLVLRGLTEMFHMSRKQYAAMHGPTTGDRVRLADTSLIIEVEKDYTVYGDEAKFGGGESLRDGMGQSCSVPDSECPDTIITNVLIIN